MEQTVKKMEAQLDHWRELIEQLAAKNESAGVRAGFEAVMYVDELKALHAIALAKLELLKAEEEARHPRLFAEVKEAWNELDAAIKRPM